LHQIIRPTSRPTLFPYTTLFRSAACALQLRERFEGGTTMNAHHAIDQLNSFLRGEISAVETYKHAFGHTKTPEIREELLDCQRRSEEHTSELQSRGHLVCRLLLE